MDANAFTAAADRAVAAADFGLDHGVALFPALDSDIDRSTFLAAVAARLKPGSVVQAHSGVRDPAKSLVDRGIPDVRVAAEPGTPAVVPESARLVVVLDPRLMPDGALVNLADGLGEEQIVVVETADPGPDLTAVAVMNALALAPLVMRHAPATVDPDFLPH